jgi:hypothetical protein
MKNATMAAQSVIRSFQHARTAPSLLLWAGTVVLFGCSKGGETPAARSDSAAVAAPAQSPAATSSGVTAVRGQLANVSDTMLAVSSRGSNVSVVIAPPLEVYTRVPATLAEVKDHSFVGVTSNEQPDGTQRATEIHIFPEKLRGTNEGSFMMGTRGGGGGGTGGAPSTMTNGSVAGPRMTNGAVAGSRMTNGSISGERQGALTVQYRDSSQTIAIPSNVTVTKIVLTQTKLAPGMNVVALATKQPDGSLRTSTVMLSPARGATR